MSVKGGFVPLDAFRLWLGNVMKQSGQTKPETAITRIDTPDRMLENVVPMISPRLIEPSLFLEEELSLSEPGR